MRIRHREVGAEVGAAVVVQPSKPNWTRSGRERTYSRARGGWPPGPEWSPAEGAEVAAGAGAVAGGKG